MDLIWDGLREALRLLLRGDREIIEVSLLTLAASGGATLISLIIGVTVGTALALKPFFGRSLIIGLINSGMGLPPTVVGLFVAILLWRSGPLGHFGLIYTPYAIVIAQAIIALPIITALSTAAIQSLNPKLRLQILALGASRWQMLLLLMREARLPLLAAVMAGFGAVISEVGAAIMVGGNIRGETRVLTTATVMEVRQGNFETAIALSLVLLVLVYIVSLTLTLIQQRRRPL